MQSDGSDGSDIALGAHPSPTGPAHLEKQENKQNTAQAQQEGGGAQSSLGASAGNGDPTMLTVVISSEESHAQVPVFPELKTHGLKTTGTDMDEITDVATSRKGCLTRCESSHEQCRVCQQQTDEALINLGCRCRGGLANAHLSCIEIWFRTKGSNKCEICQQVAVNVPPPESQTNYWVWRVDPAYRGSSVAQGRERGCFNPLWVAFSILIGGLLLDVLISISLGVSALPVNIIIGVLIVLGLGTALRLALECCHEWSLRRLVQRVETNVDVGYHHAVAV
ncbi:uncharacterized protein LOC122664054 isoform X2 [Telopea speciosissima]|uniref:uncharacterized protein LOC122664054 isoform X2 n=1 Tax=Telopea speciosissima TaxID=54955 RepID=UPI001CC7D94D|nr:uncharacterized protein LOC122664054 isoform X2 [Telopea speciosissima]